MIHTVGPVWQSWQEWGGHLDEVLAACYRRSLDLAAQHSLTSIAFPSISTGVYKFPKDRAACIAIDATREWLDAHSDSGIKVVEFVCYDSENAALYDALLET